MKSIKFLSILLLVLFASNLLKAQVIGHGKATYKPNCVLTAGMRLYTDDNRASVTGTINYSGVPITPFVGTLANITLGNIHGTFSPGNEVLLIQMKGATNIGMHQNATVVSYAYPNLVLQSVNMSGLIEGFYPGYSSADKLQVINIPNFSFLTMNDDSYILCQPWDNNDGTGGIVCFVVDNTFTINGGQVFAGGYGYRAEEDVSIIFKGSNTGEAANTTNDQLAMKGPTIATCAINAFGFGALYGTGGKGGSATPRTTKGSGNSGGSGIPYGDPTFKTSFIIGSPGYYKLGQTPPYGSGILNAGGGGVGGNGAPSICGTAYGMGLPGSSGSSGGAAGIGGNGGGGIYIKANNINLNTDNTVFVAYGANGGNGQEGGCGGRGGYGGAGGAGCATGSCVNNWPGSYGACGDWGIGGDGGDGGDGGHPGTIWISTNSVGGNFAFANSVFDVAGGFGGWGGYQGWGDGNSTPAFIYATNLCDFTFCKKPDYHNCDPDPIMCFLKYCNHFNRNPITNILRFDVNGNLNNFVEYDESSGNLYLVDATGLQQQVQVTDAGIAYDAFYLFGNNMNYPGFGSIVVDPCTPPNFVNGIWTSNNNPYVYSKYFHSTIEKYFQNIPTGKKVFFVTCSTLGGDPDYFLDPSPVERPKARQGTTAQNGTIKIGTPTNSHDNVGVEIPSSFLQSAGFKELLKSISKLSLFPNPTSGDIWLNLNSEYAQSGIVIVFDITGKEVFKQNIKLQKGDNKQLLKLDGITKGIYTLQLQTTDGKLAQQIIVN